LTKKLDIFLFENFAFAIFLSKIEIIVKNRNICQKSKFSLKPETFIKISYLCTHLWFLNDSRTGRHLLSHRSNHIFRSHSRKRSRSRDRSKSKKSKKSSRWKNRDFKKKTLKFQYVQPCISLHRDKEKKTQTAKKYKKIYDAGFLERSKLLYKILPPKWFFVRQASYNFQAKECKNMRAFDFSIIEQNCVWWEIENKYFIDNLFT